MEQTATLKQVFLSFTQNKNEMDGKTYAKLAKDCKLIDKKLTTTDIDLSFAKVKTSSSVRTITYEQFQKGVEIWAQKKGISAEALSEQITKTGGPIFQGTQGGSKFHDDKSTYTGAYKQDHEESKQQQSTSHGSKKQLPNDVVQGATQAGSLEEVFNNFSKGAKDIDGKTFMKIAKDTKALCKKVTSTDIDLIFSKIVTKGQRRITYSQFVEGCKQIADKKGSSFEQLSELMCKNGGPVFSGTQADNVKFHDDKSQYTGVYANGGPTNVDKDKISSISQTCDRSSADVRGVKK